MRVIHVAGRSYEIFRFVSIHENDVFVECRDYDSGLVVCEIRLSAEGGRWLLPTAVEIDLQVIEAVMAYAIGAQE